MIFPIVYGYDISHFTVMFLHIDKVFPNVTYYDILRFTKPCYFTFYIAKIFYIVMTFPISHSCVFHIPMLISISHSYDARRYKLIEIEIWPSISKSQQPATFQFQGINTLRSRQNGRNFPDDIFKCNTSDENVLISLENSLKFLRILPTVRIYNVLALAQIIYCHWPGDKQLSEPIMDSLLTSLGLNKSIFLFSPHMGEYRNKLNISILKHKIALLWQKLRILPWQNMLSNTGKFR